MFDLDERLRTWRDELEATLAFDSDELDELEDHLRFAYEARQKEGLAPEEAWQRALGQLGPASALAPEFTKSKLLPALFGLMRTWSKPGLLLALYFGTLVIVFKYESLYADWAMAWICLTASLVLLPEKSHKTALLLGAGNAFCLIPLLHTLIYHGPFNRFIGPDWSLQGISFGWLQVTLAIIGLFLLNAWGWKHLRHERAALSPVMGVIGLVIFLFALAPVMGQALGTLSTWEIHTLPTAAQIPYTGEVRNSFLQWKFVEVLLSCVASLNLWIALLTMTMLALGVLVHQGLCQIWKVPPRITAKIFPSPDDLPWLLMLAASGVFYVLTCFVEPPFTDNMRVTAERVGYQAPYEIGAMTWVLSTAALFLISIHELTKRWTQTERIRLFYTYALMFTELAFVAAAPLFPRLLHLFEIDKSHPLPHSVVPEWLLLGVRLAALAMIFRQIQLTWKISHEKQCEISLCKFVGTDLVRVGLLLGLFMAGAGELFMLIAMALAYQSVMLISCLIDWGNSVKDPVAHPFHPQAYGLHDHLSFLTYSGLIYVWFCLTAGLLAVIVLSGLEFIRFNCFRLYKVRKIRQTVAAAHVPALND